MTIKTSVLAAAAVLSLAVPAAALAQPVYGVAPRFSARQDDGRRFERERAVLRWEDQRRFRWERDHDDRYAYRAYR